MVFGRHPQHSDSGRRGRAFRGCHAPPAAHVRKDEPVCRIRVDDQDPASSQIGYLPPASARIRPCFREHRVEVKGAAPSGLTPDAQLSAHAMDEPAADSETQPRSSERPRRRTLRLREVIKDTGNLVRGYPGAGICYLIVQTPRIGCTHFNRQGDLAAARKLDRVSYKVQ